MSTSIPSPYNWSTQAVPAFFALGLVPHSYYVIRMMQATKGKMSSAMPRTNLETLKSQLPAQVWNQLTRARGAHLNSMEVFPLFAAAVLAGNMAGLPAQDMNSMAFSFLGMRTVYLALYMGVKSDVLAYARTGVYFWGISIPLVALWKAGKAMGDNRGGV